MGLKKMVNKNSRRWTRRRFLKAATIGTGLFAVRPFFIGKSRASNKGRIIMLGFDGMEPSVVDTMLERGELPNFQGLRRNGTYTHLTSTIPPQSPVAWNTFATCKNPGGHNIFDFIRRDAQNTSGPMPLVGTGKIDPPILTDEGSLKESAKGTNYRMGVPFWSVADSHGKRGKVLNIPYAFPPDPLQNGIMISALGVPDLRGTSSTYFSLSDSFTAKELNEELGGGRRLKLSFDGSDEAIFHVPGPRDIRRRFSDPQAFTTTTIRLQVMRQNKQGKVLTDGTSLDIEQGKWSDWLELRFDMSPSFSVFGLVRFFPLEIGDRIRIYMSCVQYHPEKPYTQFTSPENYSAELRGRFGLYKTIGWAYDTHALRQNDLDEEAFLLDIDYTNSWRDQLTLDELKRGEFDFLLSAWTDTDRVGHMFWRFRDSGHPYYVEDVPEKWRFALEHTYRHADELIGAVMEQINEEDVVLVFSDHGFGSWRTGFNLNTWLRDNGYLVVSNPEQANQGFLQGIDWGKTRAYAVGLSSLYFNLKGRESKGILTPDETEGLMEELIARLLEVRDPATGKKVFSNLYPNKVYSGEAMENAPDISLGYAPYYQNGRQTSRGGVGAALFDPVMDKWSGEHAASDYVNSPGILFTNRPLSKDLPHIKDLGVTALKFLGVEVPPDFEGEPILG